MPRKSDPFHLCPRCMTGTTKRFYCAECVKTLRRPPFTPHMLRRNAHAIRAEMEWSTQARRHESMEVLR